METLRVCPASHCSELFLMLKDACHGLGWFNSRTQEQVTHDQLDHSELQYLLFPTHRTEAENIFLDLFKYEESPSPNPNRQFMM